MNQALSAAEQPIYIESEAQLDSAAKEWRDKECLGLDTEFVRERTYRADLGLVQISDGKTVWLLDPLKIGDLDQLGELMRRQSTVKVLHSGSEDLEVLHNVLGTLPDPLADTQIACALLGQPLQMGYNHAVKWLLGIEIDKDQTRSNWLRRPLTSRQLRYAAMDVVLLPAMFSILKDRLEDSGRLVWLEEEVCRMKRSSTTPVKPEEAYLRFSHIAHFDAASMRVLKALAEWRELVAAERNLARGFVISDAALLKLAQSRPARISQVKTQGEIHPRALEKYGANLIALIAQAESSRIRVPKMEELNTIQKKQLKAMRAHVCAISDKLGIDPAMLASKKEIEKLIRARSADLPPPERFMGWRKQIVTDDLMAI